MMRLVDWNALNLPNSAADQTNFQTVLAAIGTEVIQGNSQRIDILAMQETDNIPAGGSIATVASIIESLYPGVDYATSISSVDGGGDQTGFVFDTSSVSLLESIEVPGDLTHSILRGKFRPESTLGASDFYVYSIHLKAGTTPSDRTTRGEESAVLRADADSLPAGSNVLFVGDFNLQSSNELAYSTIVSAGPAQMIDLAGPGATGSWTDNAAFKHLHSQDPRGSGTGMDDRFDIIFGTDELFDGTGLEFVDNSYRVFGNNGTHTLNGPITTGTGAAPAVLTALAALSDHLPVIADFEIISGPGVRIVETNGQTRVAEGGISDTYEVVLNTVPSANVTVTVQPTSQVNLGAGPGVAVNLLFTPANALVPQQITVSAVNDLVAEALHTSLITHTAVSSDINYNGVTIEELQVHINDNDVQFLINEIDSDTPGTDAAEFVEIYDGGVGNLPLNEVTLVFFNGGDAENAAYFVLSLDGYTTDSNGYFVIGNAGVAQAGLVFANNSLQNGADAVALYAGVFPEDGLPTSDNLIDAIVYETADPDDPELISILLQAGQAQADENSGGSGATHALARVPNGGGLPRETANVVAQTPTPGAANVTSGQGIVITQTSGNLAVVEGGAGDSYTVHLQTVPTGNVTITLDPDAQLNLGAGAGVAIQLVFTTENALTNQTVNVSAVNDVAIEGVHTGVIVTTVASSDPNYNGLVVPNVVATIGDNDSAPPTSTIVISEIMYNPGSNETRNAEMNGIGEWIEVVNAGEFAVDIGDWKFDDEDTGTDNNWSATPVGTILNPGQVAVFFDADFTDAATFRAEWSVPLTALVIGLTDWGNLSNSPSSVAPLNEVLQLLNGSLSVMDTVNYDDANLWPTGVNGQSIYLTDVSADNNAGHNWLRSADGVGGASIPTGPTFNSAEDTTPDVGSPGSVPVVGGLAGDYNDNGTVDAADYSVWRDTVGSTTDFRADGSGPSVGVPDGVVDVLDFDFWKANFGNSLGSGSSSLVSSYGNGGGMQLTVAADEPVIESQAASPLDLVANEIHEENSLAFDPAWFDVEADALSSSASVTSGDSLSAADSNDLLLVLTRVSSSNTPESFDGATSDEDDFADIDEFFATLDERALAVGLL